jgi:hypothetical protein
MGLKRRREGLRQNYPLSVQLQIVLSENISFNENVSHISCAPTNFISFQVFSPLKKFVFPTSSLKMTFPSLNLEMKVGVCITCEESKSLPSLVGKVKQKFDPHLGMYILS